MKTQGTLPPKNCFVRKTSRRHTKVLTEGLVQWGWKYCSKRIWTIDVLVWAYGLIHCTATVPQYDKWINKKTQALSHKILLKWIFSRSNLFCDEQTFPLLQYAINVNLPLNFNYHGNCSWQPIKTKDFSKFVIKWQVDSEGTFVKQRSGILLRLNIMQ